MVEETEEAAKENGSEEAPANGNGTVSKRRVFPSRPCGFCPRVLARRAGVGGPLPPAALCLGFEI